MGEPSERLGLLERRVAALRKTRPDLADALTLQEQLLRVTLSTQRLPRTDAFALPHEAVLNRVREGVPMLHDQPITLDIDFAADLFSRLVNVLSEREDPDL